jgi:hypothetical protein
MKTIRRFHAPLYTCDIQGCPFERGSNDKLPSGWQILEFDGRIGHVCTRHVAQHKAGGGLTWGPKAAVAAPAPAVVSPSAPAPGGVGTPAARYSPTAAVDASEEVT